MVGLDRLTFLLVFAGKKCFRINVTEIIMVLLEIRFKFCKIFKNVPDFYKLKKASKSCRVLYSLCHLFEKPIVLWLICLDLAHFLHKILFIYTYEISAQNIVLYFIWCGRYCNKTIPQGGVGIILRIIFNILVFHLPWHNHVYFH